jgi:ABC-2 type transport system permease protein
MLTDIATIIRKEWKEMFMQRGSRRGGLANLLIMIAIFGIFIPLQTAKEWFDTPLLPIAWSWMPVFMTTWMVADAVAGERERHTLETLLASRLSDRAILFGKLGASVLYGFSLALINLLLSAVTVNLARPADGLRFYPAGFFFILLAFILLGCGLLAGLGVLVSLRAATARQAYQRLSIVMMAVWVLPTIALPILPAEWTAPLNGLLMNADYTAILSLVCLVLLFIDALLIAAGLARFKRTRLVLE